MPLPVVRRRRPLDPDASAAGQVDSPSSSQNPERPAAISVPARRRDKATPEAFKAMRADYLKGEAERRARGYRYVCPACSHSHPVGEEVQERDAA
jgi:hypothetical protein